jgi:hypothetical protein
MVPPWSKPTEAEGYSIGVARRPVKWREARSVQALRATERKGECERRTCNFEVRKKERREHQGGLGVRLFGTSGWQRLAANLPTT